MQEKKISENQAETEIQQSNAQPTTLPAQYKTATFDMNKINPIPTLSELKKMQDPTRFEKARFRFRLYPLRKS